MRRDATVKKGRNRGGQTKQQSGLGHESEARVRGWYNELTGQLSRLADYMVPGRIVTFQQISAEEKTFFQELMDLIQVPESVCAVFIPPSVVQQAMWPVFSTPQEDGSSSLYSLAPDAGAVVAQRCGSPTVVVNALFAFPPMSPGVDVYEDGRLLAGYAYSDSTECAQGLSGILDTYLG
jgi:hypothetical protein